MIVVYMDQEMMQMIAQSRERIARAITEKKNEYEERLKKMKETFDNTRIIDTLGILTILFAKIAVATYHDCIEYIRKHTKEENVEEFCRKSITSDMYAILDLAMLIFNDTVDTKRGEKMYM